LGLGPFAESGRLVLFVVDGSVPVGFSEADICRIYVTPALKDRRGRVLSAEDKAHYAQIVVALKETIRLMEEIDEAIPVWPME